MIVSTCPMLGASIQRTAGDGALRAGWRQLGVTWHTESVVTAWDDGSAPACGACSTAGGGRFRPTRLVLATTNVPDTAIADERRCARPKSRDFTWSATPRRRA